MNVWEKATPPNIDDFDSVLPLFYDPTGARKDALVELLNVPHSFIVPSGSRHIEYPPKTTSDDDYLIYVGDNPEAIKEYASELVAGGWTDCLYSPDGQPTERYAQEQVSGDVWGAFRKGEVNIIIFNDINLYNSSVAATILCTKLNVKDKEQRIRIFRWFKFGESIKEGDLNIPTNQLCAPWEE